MHVNQLWLGSIIFALLFPSAIAADLQPVTLPPPSQAGGIPMMQALKQRKTTREFTSEKLPAQTLGDLLWAAFGINRPESDHRTAPSAMNSQEVDLYVAIAEGVFVYEPKAHRLKPLLNQDLRAKTTGQEFARQAPVVLIYVADLPRLVKAKPESRPFYAGIDTGCIVQNVYLYCSSAGLGSVVYDLDRKPLSEALALGPDQRIILCQAVGFPRPGTVEKR
jgi:SagB-type dehydrogenase family enzyme